MQQMYEGQIARLRFESQKGQAERAAHQQRVARELLSPMAVAHDGALTTLNFLPQHCATYRHPQHGTGRGGGARDISQERMQAGASLFKRKLGIFYLHFICPSEAPNRMRLFQMTEHRHGCNSSPSSISISKPRDYMLYN